MRNAPNHRLLLEVALIRSAAPETDPSGIDPGADLRDTVRDALAVRGRLFNAGRHVEQLRAGGSAPEPEEVLHFSRWLKSERMLAPPLVVEVDGGGDVNMLGLDQRTQAWLLKQESLFAQVLRTDVHSTVVLPADGSSPPRRVGPARPARIDQSPSSEEPP